MTAEEVVAALGLAPHPEGGHCAETFRDVDPAGGRDLSTAIYYLLKAGERSAWHRIDAAETWHHYAGAPLEFVLFQDGGPAARHVLGPDIAAGQRPQVVVAKGCWQAAASLGDWSLAGCTVAPGFDFAGFELAPEGWSPPEA